MQAPRPGRCQQPGRQAPTRAAELWAGPVRRGAHARAARRPRVQSSASPGGPLAPRTLFVSTSQHHGQIAVLECPPGCPVMPPALHNTRLLILDGEVHSVYPLGPGGGGAAPPSSASSSSAAGTGASSTDASVLCAGAYYDYLCLLPALVPPGAISILGLAGGTVARALHLYFPDRPLHGWELDAAVVMAADLHLGLGELRQEGCLEVHIGDALAPGAAVPGGAAGIVVDLFAGARLIPSLGTVAAWRTVAAGLAPGGRIMANVGAGPSAGGAPLSGVEDTYRALDAMADVVGDIQIFHAATAVANNIVAVSGPAWDVAAAAAALPGDLQPLMAVPWRPYRP